MLHQSWLWFVLCALCAGLGIILTPRIPQACTMTDVYRNFRRRTDAPRYTLVRVCLMALALACLITGLLA